MKKDYTKSRKLGRQIYFVGLISILFCSSLYTQAQSSPHFKNIWLGENGLNHMNFLVISAILNDIQLGASDEIAVFSGNLCVGTTTLTQPLNSANNSTFITITTSQNDGSNNGYLENDTIIFKIWDSKNQTEMLAKAVKYRNDMPTWDIDGKFTPGSTSVLEIISYTEYSQSIQLIKGTNLFSSYVMPSNPNVGTEMKPLCDQGALIKMLDENSNSFEYLATSGGWINKIGNHSNTEGYSISVNFNTTLTLIGKQVVLPLDIPLKLGWNYISFPMMDLVNGLSVVQPLINQKKLIKVQDERGYTIEKIKNAWRNNIGNFTPGKGYKINVSAACTLTIQKSYTKSAISFARPEKTDYFVPTYEGNGLDHMNINLVGLTETGFSVGDELAAFDGTLCVGSVKLNKDHFTQGSVSLIASSESIPEIQDGFTEGHSIQLYGWNKTTGIKTTIETESIDGEMKFEKLASLEINLKSATTLTKNIENDYAFKVFPNPAKDMITVRFSKMPELGRIIEITDILGKKIDSRQVHGISEDFILKNQPAGLYFVKSILGNDETIQKLILK